jgi:hypothetical protein
MPVVDAARDRFGVEVTLLRIVASERPQPHGGEVTYLAETDDQPPPSLEPWSGRLDDHPLRLPWARPGGPDADLAWADAQLAALGLRRTRPAVQVRSWNLSSLWRLPVEDGATGLRTAWLKHVPRFFAHEGAMLAHLAGGSVPALLAHEDGRILMPEIPGEDLYDAGFETLERMVDLLVELQRSWIGRVDELRALGLPDWRGSALTAAIADTVDRTAEIDPDDRATLAEFVAELPERWARIAEAGLPDTLVHGDFHPGNARGQGTQVVLLDWGDSGIGHPMLDQPAFLDRIPPDAVAAIRARWDGAWRDAVPGADPGRASALLAPIAAARQAVIYRRFLDAIEPSERPHHSADPGRWLRRAAALLGPA